MTPRILLLTLVPLLLLGACSRPGSSGEGAAAVPAQVPALPRAGGPQQLQASFDVGAIVRQVRSAYREEDGAWRGGHDTYEVRVTTSGMELRPFHHPATDRTALAETGLQPAPNPEDGRSASRLEGAPLKLGAARVRRGAASPASGEARAVQQPDGALRLQRSLATEHLVNRAEGVEQSWEFDALPAGRGELVVEVPVSGMAYVGTTDQGLHFRDQESGLGFRYEHGTWIDAQGVQTHLPAAFERGQIVLRVDAATLERSRYPAVLDPVITPEFGIGEPTFGPPLSSSADPVVASDGSGYLVVWEDQGLSGIYGSRVTSAGQVLDIPGVAISIAPGNQTAPAIAANGDGYLVVWQDGRNGSWDTYGTRVSPEGVVQDPDGIALSTAPDAQLAPAIASRGDDYLVVWQDHRGGNGDTYGTRVTRAGEVLDGQGLPIAITGDEELAPSVASDGTAYLVVWQQRRVDTSNAWDIRGTRITRTGLILDAGGFDISTSPAAQEAPAVASNGRDYFVVWQDDRSNLTGQQTDIYGTRVTSSGVVLNRTGVAIELKSGRQQAPSITRLGDGYAAAWLDIQDSSAFAVRLSASGQVQEPRAKKVMSHHSFTRSDAAPGLACAKLECLVTGQYGRAIARRFAGGLPSGVELTLAPTRGSRQSVPEVASNGTDYLIIWLDDRVDAPGLYGARVTTSGMAKDPAGLLLAPASHAPFATAVASNGRDYLVVWENDRNASSSTGGSTIHGTRVTEGGAVLNRGMAISTTNRPDHSPAVASNGTDFLVVWMQENSIYELQGARVSASGVLQDVQPLLIASGEARHRLYPAVASNGAGYLVVWQDARNYFGDEGQILGRRVEPSGEFPSGEFVISLALGNKIAPAVASNGSEYLVVWNGDGDIRGTRVSATGSVLDVSGLPIAVQPGTQDAPAVTHDGEGYVVAWLDTKESTHDLYGARVTSAGLAEAPSEIPWATGITKRVPFLNPVHGKYYQHGPGLASAGGKHSLLVYSGFEGEASTPRERVRARGISFSLAPVATSLSRVIAEDATLTLELQAVDPEGEPLTFSIVGEPQNCTVTLVGTQATIVPEQDFHGEASFHFVANDGVQDSEPALVRITVTPINDVPVAGDLRVTLLQDTSAPAPLPITDADADPLGFTVVSGPEHGTLTGVAPALVYVPAAGFHGTDRFTWRANDGSLDSNLGTVTLNVRATGDGPRATGQSATLAEDSAASLTLEAFGADAAALGFTILQGPAHGTLTGQAPNLIYTPHADFHGNDSFTWRSEDGALASGVATFQLIVTPVNDVPVALPQTLVTAEEANLRLTLAATDLEGDALSYSVVTPPSHGTLSGTPPELTYSPAPDFNGRDTFTFAAHDAAGSSSPTTIQVTVTPVNDAPVATPQHLLVRQGEQLPVRLGAVDVDGDLLRYTVLEGPAPGLFEGRSPDFTFTPQVGFHGEVRLTFMATDGLSDSNVAEVRITVANGLPVVTAAAESLAPLEGQAVKFVATAADPEGDALTFSWDFGDGQTSDEQSPVHTFADDGSYTATVTVSDGEDSGSASLELQVQNVAPGIVPGSGRVYGEEGSELHFEAAISDPGLNDLLILSWDFGDGSPTATTMLANEGPVDMRAAHTYADDGAYVVTISVTDIDGARTEATREVRIRNLPPVPAQVEPVRVMSGVAATATLMAWDPARDADPLTWVRLGGPGEVAADGTWTWNTTAADVGNHVIRAQVTDDDGGKSESVFFVKVIPPEPEPSGFGCVTTRSTSGALWSLLLAGTLLGTARRRRSRSATSRP